MGENCFSEKKMDSKYVDMLKQSYEKLKNVEVIYMQRADNPVEDQLIVEDKFTVVPNADKIKKSNSDKKRPLYARQRPFLKHEDKVILEAMRVSKEKNEKVNFSHL